jgi:t-SNARE complex subunit (syntaxin)
MNQKIINEIEKELPAVIQTHLDGFIEIPKSMRFEIANKIYLKIEKYLKGGNMVAKKKVAKKKTTKKPTKK